MICGLHRRHRQTILADEVELSWLSRALRLIRVNCRPSQRGTHGASRLGLQIPQEAAFRSGKQGLLVNIDAAGEMQYLAFIPDCSGK